MANAVKVRGRLSDPRHIELDEPVNDLTGPVDVVVTPAEASDADRRLVAATARLSETALAKVWDNPEDDVYDNL